MGYLAAKSATQAASSSASSAVTAVEKSNIQYNFIRKVAQELGEKNLTLIKGDVFKFVAACRTQFDFIFADPPYDLPRFGEIPGLVLNSGMLHPGSVFIIEHSRDYDFSSMPHFSSHRVYGSVNFSIFEIPEEASNIQSLALRMTVGGNTYNIQQ